MKSKYAIRGLDFGHGDSLRSFLEAIEPFQAGILSYKACGSAGENPTLDLSFSSREVAGEFLASYGPEGNNPELYPIICIEGDLDEVLRDREIERDHQRKGMISSYRSWCEAQGLVLGSADEHQEDEDLTEDQRSWLRKFNLDWEAMEDRQ